MSDYIKREDAIKAMERGIGIPYTDFIDVAERCMADIPTGDVVEVVRCRDCKFYTFKPQQTSRTTSVRRCNRSAIVCTKPDDYCSFGERGTT